MNSNANVPRRAFLKRMAALGGLAASGGILAACGDTPTVTTAPTTTIAPTSTVVSATAAPTTTIAPTLTIAPTSTVAPTTAPATPTRAATTVAPTTAAPTTAASTVSATVPAGFTSIGALSNFQNAANAPVGFKAGDVAGFVYLTGNDYQAFSNLCTHQGCAVSYTAAFNGFDCGCHGSQFDKNGDVVRGPARVRLFEFETRVVGTDLFAKLK
jgi:Rieske Fe-S protein